MRAPWASFRATSCPICGSDDNGNWTCGPCTLLVQAHRNLLRNLQQWRSNYEALLVPDTLVSEDGGREILLWDAITFYDARVVLPERQQQSIQFCLYENLKEKDAAVKMGIAPSNPVSVYATIGLTMMIDRAVQGLIPGYRLDPMEVLSSVV